VFSSYHCGWQLQHKNILGCGLVRRLSLEEEGMAIALYPGTFDPVTYGHLDVLTRASRLFDQVIVAVASGNSAKSTLFTPVERVRMVEENIDSFSNVSVELFDGLLVEYAKRTGATVLIRGLRVVSDFEYEFQMAQMNRHLDSALETIFLMPSQKYFFTSSQLIKQVHRYGDRETGLVPENVRLALKMKSGLEKKRSEENK
jgi:pantetheine-phosphate adenylyltransferase